MVRYPRCIARVPALYISAVIPTKNRPVELETVVRSILGQTRAPDELLIIDQSPDSEGRQRVGDVCSRSMAEISLDYVLDPSISGLVAAKRTAVSRARGDVVCFLEDDEVLEPGYIEAIERGFAEHSEMLGCCGLVTNLPPLPRGYALAFHLFHRGPFRDPRVGVHGSRSHGLGVLPLIPSDCLSGGLSCWRREVLDQVTFDVESGFHLLEDMDYSTRAAARFGRRFFINPNARLEHRMSPVNRELLVPRERRKMKEYVLFYRKRKGAPFSAMCFAWLLVGLFLECLFQAARSGKPALLQAYFSGLGDGFRQPLRSSVG